MQYLAENGCAICATKYQQIEGKLREMLDDEETITNLGRKAFECGKKNHNETHVKEIFRNTFIKVVEQSNKGQTC